MVHTGGPSLSVLVAKSYWPSFAGPSMVEILSGSKEQFESWINDRYGPESYETKQKVFSDAKVVYDPSNPGKYTFFWLWG